MSREPTHIKALMLTLLQELMKDGEQYGWPAVRAYHATWLQHMEQGWAAWGDQAAKLELHCALVWHLPRDQALHLMREPAPIISDSPTSPDFPVTSDAVKETFSFCDPTVNFPITTDTPVNTGLVNSTNNASPTSVKVCGTSSSFVHPPVNSSYAELHSLSFVLSSHCKAPQHWPLQRQ